MSEGNSAELAEIRAKFATIKKRAQSLGVSRDELGALKSVQKYKPREVNILRTLLKVIVVLIVVLSLALLGCYLLIRYKVINGRDVAGPFGYYVSGIDVDSDSCLVQYSEAVLDFFRPPTDCGFCRDVSEIVKVTNLSPKDFVEKYAYSGKPVVITDATVNWTATKHFSFNFFKKVYKRGSPVLSGDGGRCQFFRYKTDFDTLRDVFRMPRKDAQMKGKPWYVGWSNCDPAAAGLLRQYYNRPYFFPPELESSKTDWIFMGTPGYGAQMHIDNVQQSSWQAQIKGRKRWTIVPPPECYYECPHGKLEVVINPGEIIILDTNRWFHQTDILEGNMSITIGSEYD